MAGKKSKTKVLEGQEPLLSVADIQGPTGYNAVRTLRAQALKCHECELNKERSSLVVFGEGPCDRPDLAFVGEAPGEQEEHDGAPFVGPSGRLLMRMIEAMGYTREAVYLCNCLCCRPPMNRDPTQAELAACRPLLIGQLRAIQPRVIVSLGRTAASVLLGDRRAILNLRGYWHYWEHIPVRVTYHPAFLLRPEGSLLKGEAWVDLQAVTRLLKSTAGGSDPPPSEK